VPGERISDTLVEVQAFEPRTATHL
jgi:hypothetical protein